jgi:hypothetical protein
MKEFIEKLIERLKEYEWSHLIEHDSELCKHCQGMDCLETSADCTICVMNKAIEIVKELEVEYKPKTNADRIRCMTDEELAEFLCKLDTEGIAPKSIWNGEFWIDEGEGLLNWLQSEVEKE